MDEKPAGHKELRQMVYVLRIIVVCLALGVAAFHLLAGAPPWDPAEDPEPCRPGLVPRTPSPFARHSNRAVGTQGDLNERLISMTGRRVQVGRSARRKRRATLGGQGARGVADAGVLVRLGTRGLRR